MGETLLEGFRCKGLIELGYFLVFFEKSFENQFSANGKAQRTVVRWAFTGYIATTRVSNNLPSVCEHFNSCEYPCSLVQK